MLHTTHTSLAKELWVNRMTIPHMIKRWEIKIATNNLGKKHYIHILTWIKYLVKE